MNRRIARPASAIRRTASAWTVVVLATRPAQFIITKPRTWATTLLEVGGMGAITAGFFRISTTAGLMAAGVALVLIGWSEA